MSTFASKFGHEPTHTELLIPRNDSKFSEDPEVSIVVPALNEEITIGEFVEWCWEGLKTSGVMGEIIIVDSSKDRTPQIALDKGARVLRTPKNGLGQAYLDAIPFIRGNFIVMGDCDLTYDFREVGKFIESYKLGNEYVMGSRFKGSIQEHAMPSLHRYFGTPLTTWILNKIYGTCYTDIHCGMRGITKNALNKIELTSRGWEYASEMVLKAARVGLKISEVPVTFYKDREGRFSHHRRAGFWSPWLAGWINLKVMLVFSPDTFLMWPGLVLLFIGLMLAALSSFGGVSMGPVGFNLYMLLLGMTFSVLGYSLLQVAIMARNIHKLRGGIEEWVNKHLTYDKGVIFSLVMMAIGIALDLNFLVEYIENDFNIVHISSSAILGLMAVILGIQTFSFTLLLELKRRMGQAKKRGVGNE